MTQAVKPTSIGRITGIDNVSDETELRAGAVREAVNVDLTVKGMPKRRGGYALALAGNAHSLVGWQLDGSDDRSLRLIGVRDGVLEAYEEAAGNTLTASTVRGGMGENPVSYLELNGDLYWTNGVEFRRIRGLDLADTAGWPDVLGPPVVAAAVTGGLDPGDYQVAVTVKDEDGRESGAPGAELVTVAAGGGIRISAWPPHVEGVTYAVYVSGANGDLLEWALDVPVGSGPVTIGAGARGKPLETQFLIPLPPGHMLTRIGARILMAYEDTVIIGEAFRYGLCQPDRAFTLKERVTLLQGCGEAETAGAFVSGSKRTLFFGGPDALSGVRRVVYPFGAVPGSGITVRGNLLGLETTQRVAVWLATNGVFVAGLPGGQVVPLTEGQCVIPSAERAAAMLRERNGHRQILLALQGQTVGQDFGMGDTAVATVRRRGVEI